MRRATVECLVTLSKTVETKILVILAIVFCSTMVSAEYTPIISKSLTNKNSAPVTTNVRSKLDGSNSDYAYPSWVVDPTDVKPSLPPIGRSLFDYLVTSEINGQIVYDVPFPYTALVEKIEGVVQNDDKRFSPVKQVLIPLGRSLARNIARPDFFRFPRVVAVVDTQPTLSAHESGLYLKDRLYIGFGEKANILEVISYNEAAGRFEFQIVTDYQPGGTPKVFYANREVCSSCHQNGALIFSRQQWDETNANPQIAALLKQENKNFYDVIIDRGIDVPFAIDAATDRANYFSLYQLLWSKGCQSINNSDELNFSNRKANRKEVKCRGDILAYVLKYMLSGQNYFDDNSLYYRNELSISLIYNWKERWPQGLWISDPDIANRNPLLTLSDLGSLHSVSRHFAPEARYTLNRMLDKNDVPTPFEPLNQRAPLQTWHGDRKDNIKSMVTGLAGFIADQDIALLDQHITQQAVTRNLSQTTLTLQCTLNESKASRGQRQTKFICANKTTAKLNKDTIELRGRFYTQLDSKNFNNGTISSITTTGGKSLQDVNILATRLNEDAYAWSITLQTTINGLHARLPDGRSIKNISLQWLKSAMTNPASPKKLATNIKGSANIVLRHDFSLVENAIEKMVEQTLEGENDSLSAKPFRRASVMQVLFENLQMPKMKWCCIDDTDMPSPVLQSEEDKTKSRVANLQDADPMMAPFYRYCSNCHRTDNNLPPNFLQGNRQQVKANIKQCAERIYYRLSMWHINGAERSKTPMPPVVTLASLGFATDKWKYSDELANLKHYVGKVLEQQNGTKPDIEKMITTGFSNLNKCLL